MKEPFYSINANPNLIPVRKCNWYPQIAVTKKNINYANILTLDLASAKSEMTVVHQYLYQSWIISDKYFTIKTVISRIAQVELQHFCIIGKLINLLGGEPYCQAIENNRAVVWNGSMLDYTKDIKKMLLNNIEDEKMAAEGYAKQSKEIKDICVSEMLARLSLDEQLHYEVYKSFLAQI